MYGESIKEYFAKGNYPNKYEWEVLDKAKYGVLDDVVRNGAKRLQEASQRGSGQNREQVLREVVRDVNRHYEEQCRQEQQEQAYNNAAGPRNRSRRS